MAKLYSFPDDRVGDVTEEFMLISLEIEALDKLRQDILHAIQGSRYAESDFIEFMEVAYEVVKHSTFYGLCGEENIKSLIVELASNHFDTDNYCGTYLDEYAEQLYGRCHSEPPKDTAIEMMTLEDLARLVGSAADHANAIFDLSPLALQEIAYKTFKMLCMPNVIEERSEARIFCIPA